MFLASFLTFLFRRCSSFFSYILLCAVVFHACMQLRNSVSSLCSLICLSVFAILLHVWCFDVFIFIICFISACGLILSSVLCSPFCLFCCFGNSCFCTSCSVFMILFHVFLISCLFVSGLLRCGCMLLVCFRHSFSSSVFICLYSSYSGVVFMQRLSCSGFCLRSSML